MTAATIPPVVAALDSLSNGEETYAWIERGKTYAGIESVDEITNIGFDITKNNASGVTAEAFEKIETKVNELKASNPEAHFNLYTTDYKVFSAVKVASDCKLSKDNFTVYMIEDGVGTYDNATSKFFTPYDSLAKANENFVKRMETAFKLFDDAMEDVSAISSLTNTFTQGYYYTFPLAAHKNFVHLLQNKTKLAAASSKFESSLFNQVYGVYENTSEYTGNVVYSSISERVEGLSEELKETYINLVFGQYKDECTRLLTRTTVDNGTDPVPDKKLIYIGTRIAQTNNGQNFVEAAQSVDEIPANYADLDARYKEVFLDEEDYTYVYNFLNNEENYDVTWKDAGEAVINTIKLSAFNNYIAYTYPLKFCYRQYGEDYDLLFKGHPSETFDDVSKWGNYKLTVEEVQYDYRYFMHDLAEGFHKVDGEGRFIGILPGGVAAENLAYLGVPTYLTGLPSSTYTGYDSTRPILSVLSNGQSGDIHSDVNINQRYIDGELRWEDEGIETVFYNTGKMQDELFEYFSKLAEEETHADTKAVYLEIADMHFQRMKEWYNSVTKVKEPESDELYGVSIVGGPLLLSNAVLANARNNRANEVDDYYADIDFAQLDAVQCIDIDILYQEAIGAIYTTNEIYVMDNAITEFTAAVELIIAAE